MVIVPFGKDEADVFCLVSWDAFFVNKDAGMEAEFFAESGWPEEKIKRKLHIVRAILFGTVFLIETGEVEFSQQTLENIRAAVDRELDLP